MFVYVLIISFRGRRPCVYDTLLTRQNGTKSRLKIVVFSKRGRHRVDLIEIQ